MTAEEITRRGPELVVFVGLQGSGKTTWYREHFAATHVHVSKDLMPNVRNRDARQMLMIEQSLGEGRSVVVDNTNPTPQVRAPLVAAGRRFGARVIAVYFEANVSEVLIRNRGREAKARVPTVAIFTTKKKLVAPTVEEGFDEVVVIGARGN